MTRKIFHFSNKIPLTKVKTRLKVDPKLKSSKILCSLCFLFRSLFPVFTFQKLILASPTFTEAFHAHILNGQLHSYHIRPNFAFAIFVATRFRLLILGAPSLEGNLTLFYWFLSHCLLPIKWGGKGRPNLSQHGS